MGFQKTGDAPIIEVRCACGGEYKDGICQKCGKRPPTTPTKPETPSPQV